MKKQTTKTNTKKTETRFDTWLTKALNQVVIETCTDLGFNNEQADKFRKLFFDNLHVVLYLKKLQLQKGRRQNG